ncbi:MAG: class C beta-lactamase-related serine hydrolase, partial [Ignavibacteriales bacterium]
MRTIYILLSSFLFLFQNFSFPQQDAVNEKLDAFIKNVREELKLKTGLSISVVKEGKVFFSKAYGYADIEKEITADTYTPFYIASSTKSFLGTLAKILSDEGVINPDSPISVYLPELELQPPLNPDIITIRDLLTHRSGIESFAIILRTAFTGQQTDEKIMELFGSAEFTKREFRYTNTDYVLVSLIIKKVTGKDWKELMKEKIFSPLRMDNTSAIVSSYRPGSLPVGYKSLDGEAVPYSFSKTDETMHAAGGIYTSTDDLSNWLIFNLGDGTYNGKRILSEYSLDEIHSAQINYSQTFFTYNRFAYGLGWIRSDYNGRLLIHHFGSYSGARSHISFMPEEQTGVAVLINDDGDAFYTVDLIADYVYNLLDENVNADSIAAEELKIIQE